MAKNKEPIAISLTGKKLYPVYFPLPMKWGLRYFLREAKRYYEKDPNERYTIWYGRLLAYDQQFKKALDVFTKGIEKFPESFRLYRHRAHRNMSIYKIDEAVADFDKAAELVEGHPLEWEEDGIKHKIIPIPPERTQWQIFYHQNVAHYLARDFEGALKAAKRCMEYNENDDDIIACTNWIHLNLIRLGRNDEAQKIVDELSPDLNAKESKMYYNRLLVYKGLIKPENMGKSADASWFEAKIMHVTLQYGLAIYHQINGELEKARSIYQEIVDTDKQWAAFAHIASEVELVYLNDILNK
ncbi:MAG: hypothetical protein GY870_08150 [archaeon]|nr:hypothetical protein [archaeon]